MKIEGSIRPALALGVVAVCGVVIVGALLPSRNPRNGPAPVADTAPTPTAPAVPAQALSVPAQRIAAGTDAAAPATSAVRPETALLQELPKARLTRAPDSPLSDLKVSFKLESRLTQSLYMGDRWLSPPTYLQVGAGEDCTVEASIRGLNAQGKAVNTPATWRVADPDMVKVSEPGSGNTVKLTVVRPGRTTVEIASQGITKQLPLHAMSYGGTIMVAMAQE